MNTGQYQGKAAPEVLDLAEGKAATLRAQRGTVIRAVQGRVWLTQDGDARDYVVPAGAYFCVAQRGRIVVSAIDGDSRIAVKRVQPVPEGLWSYSAVRLDADFAGTLEQAARQERSRQLAALVRGAWRHVRNAWRRFLQVRSEAPTLRMREGS